MIPKPILLFIRAASFNWGTAGTYLLAVTTLSRNLVDKIIVFLNSSQSNFPSSVICSNKLMEPKQQFSYGPSHCSPHGLVASNSYKWGTGLLLFAVSIKRTPGSPFL